MSLPFGGMRAWSPELRQIEMHSWDGLVGGRLAWGARNWGAAGGVAAAPGAALGTCLARGLNGGVCRWRA